MEIKIILDCYENTIERKLVQLVLQTQNIQIGQQNPNLETIFAISFLFSPKSLYGNCVGGHFLKDRIANIFVNGKNRGMDSGHRNLVHDLMLFIIEHFSCQFDTKKRKLTLSFGSIPFYLTQNKQGLPSLVSTLLPWKRK